MANCHSGFDCVDGQCFDQDECADATLNTCVADSDCQNWQGGFSCICHDGFNPVFDPQTEAVTWCEPTCNVIDCPIGTFCGQDDQGPFCADIDECADASLIDCPQNSECENLDCSTGECQVPEEGYHCQEAPTVLPPVDNECSPACDSGFSCVAGQCFDIDECAFDDACHTFETCVNEPGSYTCEFDPSVCPSNKELKQKFKQKGKSMSVKNGTPIVWQSGTKFGKLKFHGEDHKGLQVTVKKSDFVDVRNSPYYAFLTFGRTRCGKKFQQALTNGDLTMDVMDRNNIYSIMDVYHKDDGSNSLTSVMVNLHDTSTKDLPLKSGKEVASMDYMYVFFNGLDNVDWGNKNWKQCLQKLTVGAMQDAEDPFFAHACAIWNKSKAH
jgi:hypothetical protein